MRPGIHRLAVAAAASVLVALVAGALVNSHQAALSVPDWPLSYGKLIPTDWRGNTFYEQSHRLLVALAGLVVLTLGVRLWAARDFGRVRRLGLAAVLLYLAQVLLGGAVVLLLDPPWVAVLHLVLAQVVFCMLVLVAVATSRGGIDPVLAPQTPPEVGKRHASGRLAGAVTLAVLVQIGLGALSRHPPAGQGAFVVALLVHVANAVLVLILVLATAVAIRRRRARGRILVAARVLIFLVALQWLLGVPLFLISPEPLAEEWPPPIGFPHLHAAHVAAAALLLSTSALVVVLERKRAR